MFREENRRPYRATRHPKGRVFREENRRPYRATRHLEGESVERSSIGGGSSVSVASNKAGLDQMLSIDRSGALGPYLGALTRAALISRTARARWGRNGSSSSSIRPSFPRGSPASTQATVLGMW